MKDRIPTRPGRIKLTPVGGGTPVEYVLEMADDPSEIGTPLNKETLLKDQTSDVIFGLNAGDKTPDDAFLELGRHRILNSEDYIYEAHFDFENPSVPFDEHAFTDVLPILGTGPYYYKMADGIMTQYVIGTDEQGRSDSIPSVVSSSTSSYWALTFDGNYLITVRAEYYTNYLGIYDPSNGQFCVFVDSDFQGNAGLIYAGTDDTYAYFVIYNVTQPSSLIPLKIFKIQKNNIAAGIVSGSTATIDGSTVGLNNARGPLTFGINGHLYIFARLYTNGSYSTKMHLFDIDVSAKSISEQELNLKPSEAAAYTTSYYATVSKLLWMDLTSNTVAIDLVYAEQCKGHRPFTLNLNTKSISYLIGSKRTTTTANGSTLWWTYVGHLPNGDSIYGGNTNDPNVLFVVHSDKTYDVINISAAWVSEYPNSGVVLKTVLPNGYEIVPLSGPRSFSLEKHKPMFFYTSGLSYSGNILDLAQYSNCYFAQSRDSSNVPYYRVFSIEEFPLYVRYLIAYYTKIAR